MSFTKEEQNMIEFYRSAKVNGEKPQMQQLEKQFGIREPSKVLERAGLRPRQKRPQINNRHKCPRCGTVACHASAQYCYVCGADMCSSIDKAIDAAQRLFSAYPFNGKASEIVTELQNHLLDAQREAHEKK